MNGFGDRLRAIRREQGFTQEALAELCNTESAVIRSMEKSRRVPSYKMLVQLCNVLSISPQYLMQDDVIIIDSVGREDLLKMINNLSPRQVSLLKDLVNIALKHENNDF